MQSGVPSQGPAVNPAECIVTRPTGDVRGNGAYATAVIPSGSHISDYSGQLLNKAQFYAKYPDGVVRGSSSSAEETLLQQLCLHMFIVSSAALGITDSLSLQSET